MTFTKVESYYHYCSELIFHTADNFEIPHKDVVIYRPSLDHYLNNHPINTCRLFFCHLPKEIHERTELN